MRFIVDAHLPIEISSWLSGRGYDAVHVRQIGLRDAPDASIWDEALRTGSVVITKDSDFAHWAISRTPRPSIIWLRTGNMRRQPQIDHFVRAWLGISTRLAEGVAIIEVR
ncbi:MAG: hypothetical protein DCF28_00730 [Alphaproteobacteria bacterium]|nr:MAG: hypothetical protein DCF28_00730 [Alphaproteobacteria bacterium]PZO33757.1 MAG: hypothetical protein DCE92_12575 [Alphaproteobacteria bacterium]